MSEDQVKLCLYTHNHNEIIIDKFRAQDWESFILVYIEGANLDVNKYDEVQETFNEIAEELDKKVIIVPAEWDVQFYGVREAVEDDSA